MQQLQHLNGQLNFELIDLSDKNNSQIYYYKNELDKKEEHIGKLEELLLEKNEACQ